MRTASMTGDLSAPLDATAPTTNFIQSLTSTGFTVGSASDVNGNGNTIDYIALKAGDHSILVARSAI